VDWIQMTEGTDQWRALVKVKLSLCFLTKHHRRRIGEWRYSSTHSLTSILDEGEFRERRLRD
jgi:hypothetical protein